MKYLISCDVPQEADAEKFRVLIETYQPNRPGTKDRAQNCRIY